MGQHATAGEQPTGGQGLGTKTRARHPGAGLGAAGVSSPALASNREMLRGIAVLASFGGADTSAQERLPATVDENYAGLSAVVLLSLPEPKRTLLVEALINQVASTGVLNMQLDEQLAQCITQLDVNSTRGSALALAAIHVNANEQSGRRHLLSKTDWAFCTVDGDCPSGEYCDTSKACYSCRDNGPTTCLDISGDCCSAAFLVQCPNNPAECGVQH